MWLGANFSGNLHRLAPIRRLHCFVGTTQVQHFLPFEPGYPLERAPDSAMKAHGATQIINRQAGEGEAFQIA